MNTAQECSDNLLATGYRYMDIDLLRACILEANHHGKSCGGDIALNNCRRRGFEATDEFTCEKCDSILCCRSSQDAKSVDPTRRGRKFSELNL